MPEGLLLHVADFHSWEAAAAWEDLKLGLKHFGVIEKLATVGERRWHPDMAIFCKPFAKAAVRYFDCDAAAETQKWLAKTSALGVLSWQESSSWDWTRILSR